jgi:hypothetical protein
MLFLWLNSRLRTTDKCLRGWEILWLHPRVQKVHIKNPFAGWMIFMASFVDEKYGASAFVDYKALADGSFS